MVSELVGWHMQGALKAQRAAIRLEITHGTVTKGSLADGHPRRKEADKRQTEAVTADPAH